MNEEKSVVSDETVPEIHAHQVITGHVAMPQEVSAHQAAMDLVAAALAERYATVSNEIGGLRPQSQVAAIGATNYFRGRVDELNEVRAALVGGNEQAAAQVPQIDTTRIQIGFEEVEEQRQEHEISR